MSNRFTYQKIGAGFFLFIFIFSVAFSALGTPASVFAQAVLQGFAPEGGGSAPVPQAKPDGHETGFDPQTRDQLKFNPPNQQLPQGHPDRQAAQQQSESGWITALKCLLAAPLCLAQNILNLILHGIAHALGLTTIVLVYIIGTPIMQYVIGLNNSISTSPLVQTGFKITRDVVNIGFVFGLIAIAIGTIIGHHNYNAKSLLKKFVLAAIFINFSFMISVAIIDFTAVLTKFFIALDLAGDQGGSISVFNKLSQIPNKIAWNTWQFQTGWSIARSMASFSGAMLAIIFNVIIIIVMGGVVFILLVRYIYLNILLVFAPFAWLGMVFPIAGISKKWWDKFLKQVFVMPIMFFFFYLIAKIVDADFLKIDINNVLQKFAGQQNVVFDALFGGPFLSVFAQLGQIIALTAFLIGAMMAADSLGAMGASSTRSIINTMGKKFKQGAIGKKSIEDSLGDLAQKTGSKMSGSLAKLPDKIPEIARRLPGKTGEVAGAWADVTAGPLKKITSFIPAVKDAQVKQMKEEDKRKEMGDVAYEKERREEAGPPGMLSNMKELLVKKFAQIPVGKGKTIGSVFSDKDSAVGDLTNRTQFEEALKKSDNPIKIIDEVETTGTFTVTLDASQVQTDAQGNPTKINGRDIDSSREQVIKNTGGGYTYAKQLTSTEKTAFNEAVSRTSGDAITVLETKAKAKREEASQAQKEYTAIQSGSSDSSKPQEKYKEELIQKEKTASKEARDLADAAKALRELQTKYKVDPASAKGIALQAMVKILGSQPSQITMNIIGKMGIQEGAYATAMRDEFSRIMKQHGIKEKEHRDEILEAIVEAAHKHGGRYDTKTIASLFGEEGGGGHAKDSHHKKS